MSLPLHQQGGTETDLDKRDCGREHVWNAKARRLRAPLAQTSELQNTCEQQHRGDNNGRDNATKRQR